MKSKLAAIFISIAILLSSCTPNTVSNPQATSEANNDSAEIEIPLTPFPTRKAFKPGELVDYTAQTGDTLPALALRFNTTIGEILTANPQIPREATTMPPGMPMQIPIYYRALWSSPFQIIPDHAFVNGPTHSGFNTAAFVRTQSGWLKDYRAYIGGRWRTGAEMVDYIAENYSVSPRLLLAILEYQANALTNPEQPTKKNISNIHRTRVIFLNLFIPILLIKI